ncbi:aldolase [Mycobacterium sp. SWH-M3]|nr:aldolase [Mycobacterium sp. SWH-M3]
MHARMERLFAADGRLLDVAIDHGAVNEPALLGGIADARAALATLRAAAPDAIQVTPGLARLLSGHRGPGDPRLVLRTDVSNVYGAAVPRTPSCELLPRAVETAVRLDAACVVVNLLLLPNQPELHGQCVRNIGVLRAECERVAMPLMVEPLVMAPNDVAGGYQVDGDLRRITALVRQAAELGADVIKADPCDEPAEFHQVVTAASGVPVLVRGGGRATDTEILQRTFEVMRQGACGIVYGRNIFQHPNPAAMVAALMAVVHDDVDASAAADLLRSRSAA